MLLAIAATAITRYTVPGDLVADPMCGIGTTLIEAIHLGRDAVGVEYEPRWAKLAADGIALARRQGATGRAEVIQGDARRLMHLAPARVCGKVALVVTSPPYGPSVHGHARAQPGGVAKYNDQYSRDPANLAHHGLDDLLDGITRILAWCAALLRPGGTAVITARPWRQHGELIDFPGAVVAAGQQAGLTPAERCVVLLAGIRGGQLIPRPSFFQLDNVRKARARGEPWHLIIHEDVLIFPLSPLSSRELTGTHGESGRTGRHLPAGHLGRQAGSVTSASGRGDIGGLTTRAEQRIDAPGPGRPIQDTTGVQTIFGTVRLHITAVPAGTGHRIFVGIGPAAAVDRYLSGVSHDVATDVTLTPFHLTLTRHPGAARPALPLSQSFWVAEASGNRATLSWTVTDGSYRVVAMNADGAAPVSFNTQLGLTIPHMFAIGAGLLTGGIVVMLLGGLLLVLGIRAQLRHAGAGSPSWVPDPVRSAPPPSPHAGQVPHQGAPASDTPAPAPTADP